MELANIKVSGLLVEHIIVKAPPVDRYIIKDGFVIGEPLREGERRDLLPVGKNRLRNVLIDFQKVGRDPTQKAILQFVNSYGLPLPGSWNKQTLKDISEEAGSIGALLRRYKKATTGTWDEEKRYEGVVDIAYSIVNKLKGVKLHLWGLRDDWNIADSHHAGGLTVEPALHCPDLLSYMYLQLYLIVTFKKPAQECTGCGAIFSPQRRNANFCSTNCYKAYWKRVNTKKERRDK